MDESLEKILNGDYGEDSDDEPEQEKTPDAVATDPGAVLPSAKDANAEADKKEGPVEDHLAAGDLVVRAHAHAL
eukprot:CAMPEP_0198218372 /NCGR_PEP_ID=MMETSP1445-20131203/68900_1 /TAXON_ID=36898 /ORGANISM="Pyramimonas sp., Strain CCMP2087" /LENGTH=73 /DNA_ID=CAMNT_0043895373 /DNA_START=5 /DNA_END=224 /DNA_ORIENTATION=-